MCVSYTHMYDAPNSSFLSLTRFHLFLSFESGEEAARKQSKTEGVHTKPERRLSLATVLDTSASRRFQHGA